MKGRVKYNAGGHEKADELATGCRHLQKQVDRNGLRVNYKQKVRKSKKSVRCAVRLHDGEGDFKDIQLLGDKIPAKSNFEDRTGAKWEHLTSNMQEESKHVCTRCGEQEQV